MIACSLLCPILVRRIRPGYVIGGGLAVAATGFWVLTQVQAGPGVAVAVAGVLALLAVILLRHPHPAAEAPGAATRPPELRPSDLCPSDLCPSR
jgi:hypothetical protein